MPSVLTIAGSDSGAGAGIQADLKTFAALGVYGTTVVTAVTAQNTRGVRAVQELSPEIVAAQIEAVVTDIRPDAVKTGMLASAAIIEVVAAKVKEHRLPNLVVDPVMVASSGDPLLRSDAVAALKDLLLPLAAVVTPNLAEAAVLSGRDVATEADRRRAAREIVALGAGAVVITGGHLEGDTALDLLYDGRRFRSYAASRVETGGGHGTGCTFASALATFLARGEPLAEAVGRAKEYVTEALRHAYPIGRGQGPVHHFFRFWQE
ncbi:MAG: bifunctional hydroxymethylpyrimidine kinase/phosphomethylpyrimidine kinase [Dehalococcoidia bacterium]